MLDSLIFECYNINKNAGARSVHRHFCAILQEKSVLSRTKQGDDSRYNDSCAFCIIYHCKRYLTA